MNDIDLTLTDEEDDITIIKSKLVDQYKSYKPKSSQIDKEVYAYFYGTEDKTQEFLAIQHPTACKRIKNECTISCPKCRQNFSNYAFINHIIDHYNLELHSLDSLLEPKVNNHSVDNQWCAVKCEICSLKFTSLVTLGQHLQNKHVYKDMPYVCFVCNFYRTSFRSELKRHFHRCHKSTQYLSCPLCNDIYELNRMPGKNNVCEANLFVAHLDRHVSNRPYGCDKCTLKFITKASLIYHQTVYHEGQVVPWAESKDGAKLIKKSLNVTSHTVDVTKLTVNGFRLPLTCGECGEHLGSLLSHYQFYIMCRQCPFSSYCAASFRRHMKMMHGPSSMETSVRGVLDVCCEGVILCRCGFQSLHGDRVARHLVTCQHQACVVRLRLPTEVRSGSVLPSSNIFEILNLQRIESLAE